MRKGKQPSVALLLKIWTKLRENGPPTAAPMPHCGLSSVGEEIADIVDTGGYGDVDTEGASNDPWLEQDLDEDEEEDEEVTRKLYGG